MQIARHHSRQPQAASVIDRGSSLARGLIFHAPLHPQWGMLDLVAGRPGTRTGLAARAGGMLGQLPSFGTSSYIDFAAPPSFDGGQAFTIAWVQEPRSGTGNSTVLDVRPPVGSTNSFLVYESSTDTAYQLCVGPRDGGGSGRQANFSVGLTSNGTVDRYVLMAPSGMATSTAAYVLYRNGVRITTATGSPFGISTPTGLRIGALLGSGTDPFEGGLGGVSIWQRVLTDAECIVMSTRPSAIYAPHRLPPLSGVTLSGSTYTATLSASASSQASAERFTSAQRSAAASAGAALARLIDTQRDAVALAASAITKAGATSKSAETAGTAWSTRSTTATRAASTAVAPLATKDAAATRSASAAVSAALATIKARLMTLAASVTSSAAVQRATSATRAAAAAALAASAKRTDAALSAVVAVGSALSKAAAATKAASAATSATVAAVKARLLTLAASIAATAQASRAVQASRAAITTAAGSATRRIAKALQASATLGALLAAISSGAGEALQAAARYSVSAKARVLGVVAALRNHKVTK